LKPLFSFKSTEAVPQKLDLSIGLSNKLASFIVVDSVNGAPVELSFFEIDSWDQNTISTFLDQFSQIGEYSSVQVSFASSHHTLLPIAKYEKMALQSQLQLTFPFQPNSIFLQESYADWQFYLGFLIPAPIFRAIEQKFPGCQIKHAFKPMFNNLPARSVGNMIFIEVGIQQIDLLVFRADQLLFCGTFPYTTEHDALYFLLKVCQEFSIEIAEVQLQLSGLVDYSSKLYAELISYFINVNFRENHKDWSLTNFPSHYFTLLTNNLPCVS
jgi:hypothetical protein